MAVQITAFLGNMKENLSVGKTLLLYEVIYNIR